MGRMRTRRLVGCVVSLVLGWQSVGFAQTSTNRAGAPPGAAGPDRAPPPGAAVTPAAPVAPVCPTCPPAPLPPWQVVASSTINGNFADLTCGTVADPAVSLRTVATQFEGEPGALRIDAGDLLGNAAVSRLSLERDGAAFAQAVRAMGYRALALGHRDLAGHRAALLAGARALVESQVPYVLSNLHCDAGHRALCEVVHDADDPPVVLDHGGQRVALVALAAPAALAEAAADRRAGLRLDALTEAVTREVQEAREAGATRVVLTLDPGGEHALRDALELADGFEPGAAPDVIFVHELPNGVRSVRAERSGALLVALREGAAVVAEVAPTAGARAPRVGTVPAAVAGYVATTTRFLCEDYGRTLPGGRLARSMEQAEFANYTLDVLRDVSRAEVAVINRRAFKMAALFPLRQGISSLLVQATLPFEDTVQRATVRGSVLKSFMTAGRRAGFFVRGLTLREGAVFVNGRAIDEAASYSVATTGFVAESGADGVGATIPWAQFGTRSVQSILLGWLETPGPDGLARTPSDPANHTRWTLRWTVDGQFSLTTIENTLPSLYNDAQLSRAPALALRVDSEARADADHPTYTWLNGLRIRYGAQQQTPPATDSMRSPPSSPFQENLDLITLTSKFTWRYFRNERRWFHPLPFTEAYLETEFDPPPRDAMGNRPRDWHHVQVRPTAGVTFELLPRMTFDLGVGADWAELAAPSGDPRRSAQFNMIGRLVARPGTIFSAGGRNIDAGFNLEVSFRDPGATNDLIVRAGARLSVPIVEPLKITLGYDLYGRQVFDPLATVNLGLSPGLALAHDLTAGITLQFAGARQTW